MAKDEELDDNLLPIKDEDIETGEEDTQEEEDLQEEDDKSEEEEDDKDSEDKDEDKEEDDSDKEDEEEDKDDDKEDDEDEEEVPEKFKGKTTKEVIKAYQELETLIEKKSLKKAQELIASGKVKGASGTDKEIADELEDLEKMDFSKMDPKAFAKMMDRRIQLQATQIAREMFQNNTKISASVNSEIKEAQKNFPQLKENKDFRDMVITVIEDAERKGKFVSLKEACERVAKATGTVEKKEEKEEKKEEKKEKKPLRTAVERTRGSDTEENKSEDDKVLDGIVNAGGGKTGKLGGLGI